MLLLVLTADPLLAIDAANCSLIASSQLSLQLLVAHCSEGPSAGAVEPAD